MSIINKLLSGKAKEYLKKKVGVPDMFVSLERLRSLGFNPRHIVDVGAFEGEWTTAVAQIFPTAKILMCEAMPAKEVKLKPLTNNANINYEIAVLGAEDGKDVFFTELETASSVLEEQAATHNRVARKTSSLNTILAKRNIPKVDLIKLDVQGYELEVLAGFDKYIATADAILTEASLLEIHKGVPLIGDVINFMGERGFVLYDICSVSTRRPLDNALWQTDLLFVKENSIFRRDKRYNA